VTRAYGVPVVGGGSDTTEGLRSRVVQGRPNWWVILAVSLALMALLVATSGSSPHPLRHGGALASATAGGPRHGDAAHDQGGPTRVHVNAATTTTTTAVPHPPPVTPATSGPSLLSAGSPGAGTPPATGPSTTTTSLATTTTTTTASPAASQPADRMQTQGYLDPPLQASNGYGFTGTGAMQISVLWSGTTYLTMSISCPNGNQNVGGTSAMEASLPDATGNCRATVGEPSSESAALTYTITIGPAGG
jgi:hypothetical protein